MKKMLYAVAVRSAVLGLSINMVSFAEEAKKQEPQKQTWRAWAEKRRQWALDNKGTIAFGVGCLVLGMIIANQKNSISIPVTQIPAEPKAIANGHVNGQSVQPLRLRAASSDSGSPRNGLPRSPVQPLELTTIPLVPSAVELRVDKTRRFVGRPHERRTAAWALDGQTLKDRAIRDLSSATPNLPPEAWAIRAISTGDYCVLETLVRGGQIKQQAYPALIEDIKRQRDKYEAKGIDWLKRIKDMPTKLDRCMEVLPLDAVLVDQ